MGLTAGRSESKSHTHTQVCRREVRARKNLSRMAERLQSAIQTGTGTRNPSDMRGSERKNHFTKEPCIFLKVHTQIVDPCLALHLCVKSLWIGFLFSSLHSRDSPSLRRKYSHTIFLLLRPRATLFIVGKREEKFQ